MKKIIDNLPEEHSYLIQKRDNVFEYIVKFSLIVYLESIINVLNKGEILKLKYLSEKEENNQQIIAKKYAGLTDFIFFDHIANTVIGIESLDDYKLQADLIENLNFLNDSLSPEQQLLKDLEYYNVYKLTDEEYKEKTELLVEYIKEDKYKILDYPILFHFITRFGNPLKLDIKELVQLIENKIEHTDMIYISNLPFELNDYSGYEFFEYIGAINNKIIQKNKEAKTLKETEYRDRILELFKDNFFDFANQIKEFNNPLRTTPIFKTNNDYFLGEILNLAPLEIISLGKSFESRYMVEIYEGLYSEKIFLNDLLSKINEVSPSETSFLRKNALSRLEKSITYCLGNFHA